MRGGKRLGAGRPSGSPNKASQERQAVVAASGEVPLDYMLKVMRDENEPKQRRDDMAKAAAPYVHPRLSNAEVKSEVTHRYAEVPAVSDSKEQWQQQHAPTIQ